MEVAGIETDTVIIYGVMIYVIFHTVYKCLSMGSTGYQALACISIVSCLHKCYTGQGQRRPGAMDHQA